MKKSVPDIMLKLMKVSQLDHSINLENYSPFLVNDWKQHCKNAMILKINFFESNFVGNQSNKIVGNYLNTDHMLAVTTRVETVCLQLVDDHLVIVVFYFFFVYLPPINLVD